MQSVLPSAFKRGMVLLLDGTPQVLEEFHLTGTAPTKHRQRGSKAICAVRLNRPGRTKLRAWALGFFCRIFFDARSFVL